MKTFVIAEAGVNHNGNLELAIEMVDAAARAGADAVKFQTFNSEKLVTKHAQMAAYQSKNLGEAETASQLEMLRKLEISPEAHHVLAKRCKSKNIEFLSSPFDMDSLAWLVDSKLLHRIKIGSGEITNFPLLVEAGKSGLPVILSTGICTLAEVERGLGALAAGYLKIGLQGKTPEFFDDLFNQEAAKRVLAEKASILHCVSDYPAHMDDLNLLAVPALKKRLPCQVGFSDHSQGIAASIAAVALGAGIIEKHFTMDKSLPGPDHLASLDTQELAAMVKGIREIEVALGNGKKEPKPNELRNKEKVRKSLVALRDIQVGELFTVDNIGSKRPGSGLAPSNFWLIMGKPASRFYSADDILDSNELES